ncbi:MAG: hypothetical protein COA81_12820 [Alphaproteobacteria bacterium]|nr:MAG: hypothetical protein COA81_12820 [Alphaproteobacteria bacterium]
MPTKKSNFTEDFREEAVRLALTSDQPHHDTALNLGVGKSTLSKWIRQYRHQIQPDKPRRDKDEELKRLRKENKILRAQRDLLKKAAAFFGPKMFYGKVDEVCSH